MSAWLVVAADLAEAAEREAGGLPERGLASLVLVQNHPGCSIDWLHRRLRLTQSGTVRLVDRLQRMELIERTRTPGRKEVALHVTRAGKARLGRGLKARAGALAALLEPLSDAEQTELTTLVAKALAGGRRRRQEADIACRLCDWAACRPDCPLDASVTDDPDTAGAQTREPSRHGATA
jgi:DNA-binding MarR family transcriptional regulator